MGGILFSFWSNTPLQTRLPSNILSTSANFHEFTLRHADHCFNLFWRDGVKYMARNSFFLNFVPHPGIKLCLHVTSAFASTSNCIKRHEWIPMIPSGGVRTLCVHAENGSWTYSVHVHLHHHCTIDSKQSSMQALTQTQVQTLRVNRSLGWNNVSLYAQECVYVANYTSFSFNQKHATFVVLL